MDRNYQHHYRLDSDTLKSHPVNSPVMKSRYQSSQRILWTWNTQQPLELKEMAFFVPGLLLVRDFFFNFKEKMKIL